MAAIGVEADKATAKGATGSASTIARVHRFSLRYLFPFAPRVRADAVTLTAAPSALPSPLRPLAALRARLDQAGVEKYLRDLAQKDHGDGDVAALLDGLIALRDKFSAIGRFADSVLARITIAGDAIIAREEALAGRAAR